MAKEKVVKEKAARVVKPLFQYYRVKFTFLTSLCASVPANPDVVKAWLDARASTRKVYPPNRRSINEIQEEVAATIATEDPKAEREAEETKSLLVFQRINGQLVMRAGTVRAHIKDCARIISTEYVGKIEGEKSWAVRVINCVYYDETQYWLPICDAAGQPFTEPTGRKEKAVRLWNGNALKAFEYVEGANLQFRLKILGDNIDEHDLNILFTYGGTHGYGGERGDGEGRYVATIEKEDMNGGGSSSKTQGAVAYAGANQPGV
jgi:hypothetical protein